MPAPAGVARDEPAALPGNADRHHLVAGLVERAITARADWSETSCSPERPPNSTPTRNRRRGPSLWPRQDTLEFWYLLATNEFVVRARSAR